MVGNLRISTKLIGAIGLVAALAGATIGVFAYRDAQHTFREQATAQIEAVRSSRVRLVSTYFGRIIDDARVASRLVVTRQMLRGSSAVRQFHPVALGLIDAFGYDDVFIVRLDGTVTYAAARESVRGTSLRSGPFSGTGLADAFNGAVTAPVDSVRFVDFRRYDAPFGGPAAFVSAPVFDDDGRTRLGVIAYQVPTDEINAIMTDRAGLGESGETYLVGPDSLMRTDSRFDSASSILRRKVGSSATRRALAGETGTIEQADYRGVAVEASFAPVPLGGGTWALIAEVDIAEMLKPIAEFRSRVVVMLLVVSLVSSVVLLEALRRIVLVPVRQLVQGARRVAKRQYDQPVRLENRDELGQLGVAFDGMMAAVARQVGELQRGQQLLEAAPDAMVVIDKTGAIVLVNGSCERLFQFKRDELIGQRIELLVPDAVKGGHVAKRDDYMRRPSVRAMGSGLDLWGRRKDGSLVPVEISLSPLDSPDGLLVVAAVRDISDRRAAEQQLKLVNMMSDAALDLTASGYWFIDFADTGFWTASDRARALYGMPERAGNRYSIDEWYACIVAVDEKSAIATRDHFTAVLNGEQPRYDATYPYRRPVDGKLAWFRALGYVERDASGAPIKMNGVVQDVTEQRKLQDLRDNLTHMIVHDLRSPITGIMGSLYFLKQEADKLSEDTREMISGATTATTTLVEMISSLLDVSRLESGEMPLNLEDRELGALVDEALASVSGLTVNRSLVQERAESVHATCDPELIRRVIVNLLGNALKFTPKKGTITIAVLKNGGRPRVEVRDTGSGIPLEFHARVFEKFGQVGSRKKYSTGLGLTFCKLAVEAHGGAIGLESVVGKGSTFWFELPSRNN
jgi:PAS domain S-box-containing protein